MKNLAVTVLKTVLVSTMVGAVAFAGAEETTTTEKKSVRDFPKLEALFLEMSEDAGESSALAYFAYTEDFSLENIDDCKVISAKEAVNAVISVIERIIPEGEDGDGNDTVETKLPGEVSELKKLLGRNKYLLCEENKAGRMTYTQSTFLIGLNKGYRIGFEIGYED